jgi:ABC-type multidrug transport system fused ATPase/permease subunit
MVSTPAARLKLLWCAASSSNTKWCTPACAGTAAYPATLFTDAPLHVLRHAIAAVAAASTPLPAPSAPRPLLRLQQLSYSTAGGWPCVAGLSLDVQPGGAVLVEGRSGCGKSTLVRVLAGLHPVQSGALELPHRDQVRAQAQAMPWCHTRSAGLLLLCCHTTFA